MSTPTSIRNEEDYERALAEFTRLWGADGRTPDGERLDTLATMLDAYEAENHPIGHARSCNTEGPRP